jgi:hypothetical protein
VTHTTQPNNPTSTPTPRPNIRSMPDKLYQLTDEDLNETRVRQQAVMVSKATYLMVTAGYSEYLKQLVDKYGFDASEVLVNLETGRIQNKTQATPS